MQETLAVATPHSYKKRTFYHNNPTTQIKKYFTSTCRKPQNCDKKKSVLING